jgi:hypothetical protein
VATRFTEEFLAYATMAAVGFQIYVDSFPVASIANVHSKGSSFASKEKIKKKRGRKKKSELLANAQV